MNRALKGSFPYLAIAVTAIVTSCSCAAQNLTWTNALGTERWGDAANWNPKQVPAATDTAIFTDAGSGGSAATCRAAAGVVAQNLAGIELRAGYTGEVQFEPNFAAGNSQTLTVTGNILVDGGRLIFRSDPGTGTGVTLNAAQFTVGALGLVHADGTGFGAGQGPGGAGADGRGGTHAGRGAQNPLVAYGTPATANTSGSGGFEGAGGGAFRINCNSGTITINGTLRANGQAGGDSGWLPGWSRRKAHSISGSAGAGAGYQVQVTVHAGSGSDSAGDVFLNGQARSDFGDVRFTDASGERELAHWLQSKVDGDNAVYWVKVEASLDAAQTIQVYYGNATASSASNGNRTFLFFDDASGTFSDKWQVQTGSAAYGVENGRNAIRLTSTTTDIRTTNFQMSGPLAIEADLTSSAVITAIQYYQDATPVTNERYHARIDVRGGEREQIVKDAALAAGALDTFSAANTWVPVLLTRDQNANHQWTVGGLLSNTRTNDTTYSSGYLALNHHNAGTGAASRVRVRKYVSPEPPHGSWGTEQLQPAATAGGDAGAGGSIRLDCATLAGAGRIEARGGDAPAGGAGGGGGRIALWYTASSYTGVTEVRGGAGGLGSGGAGSVVPGNLRLLDHGAGQATSAFIAPGNYAGALLYRFGLRTLGNPDDPAFEPLQVNQLVFELSGVTGVVNADLPLAGLTLYADNDNNGAFSVGDTLIPALSTAVAIAGATGTLTLDFGPGTLLIDDGAMAAGGRQYLLRADVNNLAPFDGFTLSLRAADATLNANGTVLGRRATEANAATGTGFAMLQGGSSSATHLSAGNAPVAVGESFQLLSGTTLSRPAPGVLSNDTDADGDLLTAVLVATAANGTLTLLPNGSFTYTPGTGFVGTDSFSYRAFDGILNSNTVTVTLLVVAPLAPNPAALPAVAVLGQPITLSSAPAGGSGTYASFAWSGPGGFSSTLQNPGAVKLDQPGVHTFTLTVTDSLGFSGSATLTVAILGSALEPNATATPETVPLGGSVSLSSAPSGGSGVYTAFAWSGPGGFSSTSQSPGLVRPATPGLHLYSLTVTDAAGLTASETVAVLVGEPLNSAFSAPGSIRYRVSSRSAAGSPIDSFRVLLQGVVLSEGDRVALVFNGVKIGDLGLQDGLTLDEKGRAIGQLGAPPHVFHHCKARYKASKRRLLFTAAQGNSARNGQPMVAASSGTSQPVQVTLLVDRASPDGVPDQAVLVPARFQVKVRSDANGETVESGKSSK